MRTSLANIAQTLTRRILSRRNFQYRYSARERETKRKRGLTQPWRRPTGSGPRRSLRARHHPPGAFQDRRGAAAALPHDSSRLRRVTRG